MLQISEARHLSSLLSALDDTGAETLRRYVAQIQYCASLCVQMLSGKMGIESVTPEGGEDVVVVRNGRNELRQVKTRQESRGPWPLSQVLPILCQQYSRRSSFGPGCTFHFVSDQVADNRTIIGWKCGPLQRLKLVLDLRRRGELRNGEREEYERFIAALCPRIVEKMAIEHSESITEEDAEALLVRTEIETAEPRLSPYPWDDEFDVALEEIAPGQARTIGDLRAAYRELCMDIILRIINLCPDDRTIRREHVLDCWSRRATSGVSHPELAGVPGHTVLDKKCHLGGFSLPEARNFKRRKLRAEAFLREAEALGEGRVAEDLRIDLTELQARCLRAAAAAGAPTSALGPSAYDLLCPQVEARVRLRRPEMSATEANDTGLGLVWLDTDQCFNWWHLPAPSA